MPGPPRRGHAVPRAAAPPRPDPRRQLLSSHSRTLHRIQGWDILTCSGRRETQRMRLPGGLRPLDL